jgi:hypothetical protein
MRGQRGVKRRLVAACLLEATGEEGATQGAKLFSESEAFSRRHFTLPTCLIRLSECKEVLLTSRGVDVCRDWSCRIV